MIRARLASAPWTTSCTSALPRLSRRAKSERMRTIPSTFRASMSCCALRHRGEQLRVEIRRQAKTGGQFRRLGRGIFQDDGQRNILHVQRQSVAEQQDQHQRQHDADGDAAGIAKDLPRFFSHQRPDAPHSRKGMNHGSPLFSRISSFTLPTAPLPPRRQTHPPWSAGGRARAGHGRESRRACLGPALAPRPG